MDPEALPNPAEDWETFYSDIAALLSREDSPWNPIAKSKKQWIDMKLMADKYGGKAEKIRRKKQKKMLKNEKKLKGYHGQEQKPIVQRLQKLTKKKKKVTDSAL